MRLAVYFSILIFFKKCNFIAIDLRRKKAVDADPKAMQ